MALLTLSKLDNEQAVYTNVTFTFFGYNMITKNELANFFQKHFPQANFIIESVGDKSATIIKNKSFKTWRNGTRTSANGNG